MDSQENIRLTYGIWLPGEGWVRGKDDKVFADYSLAKVRQVATLLGRGASVRFIDPAIVDLERKYLEQERRTLWSGLKNLWMKLSAKLTRAWTQLSRT